MGGGKVCSSLFFGVPPPASKAVPLHIKCPQLVRTAAGYARYAYMPR